MGHPLWEIIKLQAVAHGAKVRITIEFKDGTKDGISTLKNHYYKIFIDVMKKNSIEVIESTKGSTV